MQRFVRRALIAAALIACNAPRAGDDTATGAAAFTKQHARHKLEASVAGSDCRLLLIETSSAFDDDLVESIQYGTGDYAAFGGVDPFARDRGFRAVVYRDAPGRLWTYGATTRDEAQSMSRCR